MYRTYDIESKTRILLNEFTEEESEKNIESLRLYYNNLESKLLDIICLNLMEEIMLYSKETNMHFEVVNIRKFLFNNDVFNIDLGKDIKSNNRLVIYLRKEEFKSTKSGSITKSTTLNSLGQFNKISIKFNKSLDVINKDLIEVLRTTLDSGYRYISEFIKSSILDAREKAVDKLYSHLRTLFAPNISNQIYLFAVTKKKGIYLVDPLQYQRMSIVTKPRKIIKNSSPLELITSLSTRLLDEKDLAVRETIPNDITVVVKQSKTKFSAHNIIDGIGKAECAVHQIDEIVVQPIVLEKPIWIEAAYPPNLRYNYKVEEVLRNERDKFTQIIKDDYSISKVLNRKMKIFGMNNQVMELWGSFWGSFIKSYTES